MSRNNIEEDYSFKEKHHGNGTLFSNNIIKNILYLIIPILIGIFFKIVIFYIGILTHGNPFLSGATSNSLWSINNIEYYSDFDYYTMGFVNSLFDGDLPYTHYFYSGTESNIFMTYTPYLIYPPFYLYIISMFGNSAEWMVALPILIFDIITAIFVFLITKKIWDNNFTAAISGFLFMINPLNLYYIDYAWLNTSIFTLFTVISIYFLIENRFNFAFLFLSLSIMCKQFSGILLPIFLIRYSRIMQDMSYSKLKQFKNYLKILSVFLLPIILLSIPYILPFYPDFPDYFYHIFAMGSFESNLSLPSYTIPIDFAVPFIAINLPLNALQILKYSIEYYILLITSTIIICSIYSFLIKRNDLKSYNKNTMIICLILLISMTLFFPRGFYKYYTVLFVPLMSIMIMKNLKRNGWNNWKKNITEIITDLISIGIYLLFSISIIFIHRYFTPLILLFMISYYGFYGYVNFSFLLRKVFRIYSRKINSLYEKYGDKM